jgi:hypothetical protein
VPLEVLELSFVLVGARKVVGSLVFGEGVAGSPVSVESSANDIVFVLDSNLGVYAARTWEIILRSVKRAFDPTLDPWVFGRSLEWGGMLCGSRDSSIGAESIGAMWDFEWFVLCRFSGFSQPTFS